MNKTSIACDTDRESVSELVREALKQQRPEPTSERRQPLTGILEIVILQVLIPIFVGATGAILADVLKGRGLTSLMRREAEATLNEITAKPRARRPLTLDKTSLAELRRVLAPYGLSDEAIKDLYSQAIQRLMMGEKQTDEQNNSTS